MIFIVLDEIWENNLILNFFIRFFGVVYGILYEFPFTITRLTKP